MSCDSERFWLVLAGSVVFDTVLTGITLIAEIWEHGNVAGGEQTSTLAYGKETIPTDVNSQTIPHLLSVVKAYFLTNC